MAVTDPIADMLVQIKNASRAKLSRVRIPASNVKREIARVLRENGYISDYKLVRDKKQGILIIYLRYIDGKKPVITGIKRVSKPGRRVYVKANEIPRVQDGLGIAILSTSQGIMSDIEARRKKIGGEVLAYVW
ncbi:MAG: 30S ribosomal protein S8 [Armatimonadota bacterium]|nr:30S ribosomal protein S8 [Armatimonadota bacterium]MCX7776918.1 30S ribosomal protein S8 [Armatimonadota bacterium]MDW8024751.1 30S ribosomal protein S8 [Armatimonadota bacterium]